MTTTATQKTLDGYLQAQQLQKEPRAHLSGSMPVLLQDLAPERARGQLLDAEGRDEVFVEA